MGKISEVLYKTVEPDVCTIEKASEFYYHYNMIDTNDSCRSEYEKYETDQINIKNKIIGDALRQGELPRYPDVNSIIFGISSILNKPVLIVEY